MSMETLHIRPFAPTDKKLVEDFFDAMGPESRAFFNRLDGNRNLALRAFEPGDTDVLRWLAEDEGRMVGYIFTWDIQSSIPWIGIAVADDYKGRHLGHRLLETVKQWAVGLGKGGLLLTTHQANIRAQVLYEKFGFTRMGTHWGGEVLYLLHW
ncbi:MAG: GNAT family N-acetyltransferase [Clostridia bacterium]|nr:GNAT family N-acetyltransferase [Clostridia bacterium]